MPVDETQVIAPQLQFDAPWPLLAHARTLPLAERLDLLPAFKAMVVKEEDAATRDALIKEGADVFRYRVGTIRTEVDQVRASAAGVGRVVGGIAVGPWLLEAGYRPGEDPPVGFFVFNLERPDDIPQWAPSWEHDRVAYYPPAPKLAESGTILLPSGIEEPGSEIEIHQDLVQYLKESVYVPTEHEGIYDLQAVYARMTWLYDKFDTLAYARFLGDYGTAKTRWLLAVGGVCYRAVMTMGSIGPAPIYRMLEVVRGTMVIDEGDYVRNEAWADLMKILCVGYQRGFHVLRMDRNSHGFEPQPFDCYGPKILATRQMFPDPALESRCLTYTTELLPTMPKGLPLTWDDACRERAQHLRNRLLIWRVRNWGKIKVDPRERVAELEPRAQQVALPLLAVCTDKQLKSVILERIVDFGSSVAQDRQESLEARILTALQTLQARPRPDGVEATWRAKEVADALNFGKPERQWVSEEIVSRRLRALGFKRASSHHHAAVYLADEALLRRRLRAYKMGNRRPI